MNVKVTNNVPKIMIDTQRNTSLALRLLLDGIDKAAFPRTPKRAGNLRQDIKKRVLGLTATIQWPKDYAAPQEAGIIRGSRIRKYTTPGTGPHFAENAVKQVVSDNTKYFRQAGVI